MFKAFSILTCISLFGACSGAIAHAHSETAQASPAADKRSGLHAFHPGQLANGLSYIIVPRRSAAFQDSKRVSIRMRVEGGWRAEGRGENGLVHLIEHLPRDANGEMSPAEVIAFRDQRTVVREWGAFTSPYASEYFLTTRTNDLADVAEALRFFRGIASGLRISAELVDRNRQIVINEGAGRLAQDTRLYQRARALAPGSERDVSRGYNSSDVATASIKVIDALYARVYRPENVTFVIVGDVEPAEIDALLRSSLGTWSPGAQSAAHAAHVEFDANKAPADVSLQYTTDIDAPGRPAVLAVLRLDMPYFPQSALMPSRREAAMLNRIIALILSHRLNLQALDTGLGSAAFTVDDTAPGSSSLIWQADPAVGDWRPSLAILLDQVAAAQEGGFTARELAIAKRVILREISDQHEQALLHSNSRVSASITEAITSRYDLQSEQSLFAVERRFLTDISLEKLNNAWRRVALGKPLRARLEGFAGEGGTEPSNELASFVSAYKRRPLRASNGTTAEHGKDQFSGQPGTILSDERSPDGIRSVAFANGSTLRLVKREHQGKYLEVAVYANAPEARARLTHCETLVLPYFVRAGGTAAQVEREIHDASWGRDIRNFPFEDEHRSGIRTGASVRSEDAAAALGYLFAYISDPGFRDSGDEVARGRARDALSASPRDPLRTVVGSLEGRLEPGTIAYEEAVEERCASSAEMARA